MTRPRGQNGWIRRVGPSWVGFWRVYESLEPGSPCAVRQRKIGPVDKLTRTAAQQLFRAFMVRMDLSELPLAATVADAWDAHKGKYERTSKGQRDTMMSLWRVHLDPVFGAVLLSKVRPRDIEGWFDMRSHMSESFLDKARTLLHALFERAKEDGVIGANPVARAYIRIESQGPQRALTAGEVRAIRGELGGDDLLKFDLLWMLGLDRSAARALRGNDITEKGLRIDEGRVEGQSTKLKTKRRHAVIALPADLAARLAPLARLNERWLWPALRGSGPWNADAWLSEVLRPACGRAGVEGQIDFRVLRRTTGTLLQQAGAKPAAAAGVLRNSPAVVLEYYTDPSHATEQRKALDAVMTLVEGKAGRIQ